MPAAPWRGGSAVSGENPAAQLAAMDTVPGQASAHSDLVLSSLGVSHQAGNVGQSWPKVGLVFKP